MITHKTCSKCGLEKPVSDFHARPDGAYGLYAQCKRCIRSRTRANAQASRGVSVKKAPGRTEVERLRHQLAELVEAGDALAAVVKNPDRPWRDALLRWREVAG